MEKGTNEDALQSKLNRPFPVVEIPVQSAEVAYESVLKNAGAALPQRDTLDQRIIADVKNGTGKFIDVQGGYPHGTAYELTKTAWPSLISLAAPVDSDRDGMPDVWEKKYQLNPLNGHDAALNSIDRFYTNIEMYINGL